MTPPKRKYVRLPPSAWAELRALWAVGDTTLAELSDRYEVSRRAIQGHLSKHGSIKGAKAAEMAAVVQKEIFKSDLGDQDTLVARARETREAAYASAVTIQDLMMAQLQFAQKDPTQAFKAATDLSAAELEALDARNGDDEVDEFDAPLVPATSAVTETFGTTSDEEDGIVVEGDEATEQDQEPTLDDKEVIATDADGYRLIKGATP